MRQQNIFYIFFVSVNHYRLSCICMEFVTLQLPNVTCFMPPKHSSTNVSIAFAKTPRSWRLARTIKRQLNHQFHCWQLDYLFILIAIVYRLPKHENIHVSNVTADNELSPWASCFTISAQVTLGESPQPHLQCAAMN